MDFLEYFCKDGDFESFLKPLFGYNEVRSILEHFSLNPTYTEAVSSLYGFKYKKTPSPSQEHFERLLSLPLHNKLGLDYLKSRGFGENLIEKYGVLSFTPEEMFDLDLGDLKSYWLFNREEVDHRNYLLNMYGLPVSIHQTPFVLVPSRDRDGLINNLALRVVDGRLSPHCKWMFTHGRQATFGLEKIDPSKEVYIVEGFFDQVAMEQVGYQAVGLGSPIPSTWHMDFLKGLDLVYCFDQDSVGEVNMKEFGSKGKLARMDIVAKDPWDAYQKFGSFELIPGGKDV